MANTDKLSEFRAEAERLGVKVEPPSVNRSGVDFEVEGNTIHYALAALKGVGREAVEAIVEARGDRPFRDLTDFAGRINPRAINKRVLESLAAAGAFDALEPQPRARPCRRRRDPRGGAAPPRGRRDRAERTVRRRRDARANCRCRRSSRGCRPSGCSASSTRSASSSPATRSTTTRPCSSGCACSPGRSSASAVKPGATAGQVAGTVVSRAERRTKTGNKMGILDFSDPSGHYEAVIFQEGLQQYRDLLEPGAAVLLILTAEAQGEDVRARIQSVERLDQAAEKLQKGLRVFLRSDQPIEGVAKRLEPAQPPRQGRRRGQHGPDARRRRRRGRGEASRPLQGLAADRRRHQGGAGRDRGGGGVAHDPGKVAPVSRLREALAAQTSQMNASAGVGRSDKIMRKRIR